MAWLNKLPSGQGTCQAGKLAERAGICHLLCQTGRWDVTGLILDSCFGFPLHIKAVDYELIALLVFLQSGPGPEPA